MSFFVLKTDLYSRFDTKFAEVLMDFKRERLFDFEYRRLEFYVSLAVFLWIS